MRRDFAGLTIRRKLTSLSVLSSMTALISASIVFLVYDARTFRDRLASRLGTEAQIISFNTVTPLLFNDSEAAGTTLGGLQAEHAVLSAGIFRAGEDRPFAVYGPDPASRAAVRSPGASASADIFERSHLTLVRPVQFEGKLIGHITVTDGRVEHIGAQSVRNQDDDRPIVHSMTPAAGSLAP